MIDIHCHILPSFDDGVRTMEEAVALIGMEVSGGTKAFISTPHIIDKLDYDRIAELPDRLEAVRQAVKEAGIDVVLYQGGEIYPTANMLKAVDEGKAVTMGGKGKHMLVDLPMGALPNDFDYLLYELKLRGVTPVLAHPERVGPFQQNPDAIREYIDKGIMIQVNTGSIAGKYGPRAVEVGLMYIRQHLAQFLASDSHRPGRRPGLGTCVEALSKEISADYLQLLTVGSPEAVLAGRELPERPPAPPAPKNKGGFFGRLFKR